jgi:hypothetical protein
MFRLRNGAKLRQRGTKNMILARNFAQKAAFLAAPTLFIASCGGAGAGVASGPAPADEAKLCDAGPAQSFVGQTVSEALGAAILAQTGSRSLRWGPPRSAWTMDYRQDRVNVRYDDTMKILDITCG